jgi:large-conductance mechanosensitive channel
MEIPKISIINNFFDFLEKFNIIPLAFSLVISLNLNQLVNSFGLNIITPIINTLFQNKEIKLEERTVTIFNITFGYGKFLISLIQFFITVFTLYLMYLLYNYITNEELNIVINPIVKK